MCEITVFLKNIKSKRSEFMESSDTIELLAMATENQDLQQPMYIQLILKFAQRKSQSWSCMAYCSRCKQQKKPIINSENTVRDIFPVLVWGSSWFLVPLEIFRDKAVTTSTVNHL